MTRLKCLLLCHSLPLVTSGISSVQSLEACLAVHGTMLLSMQSTASQLSDVGVPQSLLRQAEQAAKCEALIQMDALREGAAAAAEDKRLADAALTETRSHLLAACAQVSDE